MHAHIFTVDKLAVQGSQRLPMRFDMSKNFLEAAHDKFSLRVDFTQFIHHRKDVLL